MKIKTPQRADAIGARRAESEMDKIPLYPKSWYSFGPTRQLRSGPVTKTLLGRKMVAFRTSSGQYSVMDARCSHMGADLGKGCVVGENIQCPFHGWQYSAVGRCVNIPTAQDIPKFAQQTRFPSQQRHGDLFFFNAPEPLFPLPYFSGYQTSDLVPAKPFTFVFECPWYMLGANVVDLQHFSTAHDRRIKGRPVVEFPAPFAHHTTTTLLVEGRSCTDRLTRFFAGNEVTTEATNWAGTLLFACATFRRMRSFGMLTLLPLGPRRTLAKVTVFTKRSEKWLGRTLYDPLNVWIRRLFIQKFLCSDVHRLAGASINPHTLIEADGLVAEYCDWLVSLSTSRNGYATDGETLT